MRGNSARVASGRINPTHGLDKSSPYNFEKTTGVINVAPTERIMVNKKKVIVENLKSLFIAFLLAMFIRTFFVQAFKIPSSSMTPTLEVGDRLLANKLVYKFREPERGEIIIFKYPLNPRKDFVKRLIALPGEEVKIIEGKIFINGKPTENPLINARYYSNSGLYGTEFSAVVPEDSYYVLGDNSRNSKDSRYWGFVPKSHLIGKPLFAYWPLNRIRIIR